jgi:hypothetical protein
MKNLHVLLLEVTSRRGYVTILEGLAVSSVGPFPFSVNPGRHRLGLQLLSFHCREAFFGREDQQPGGDNKEMAGNEPPAENLKL